MGKDERPMPRPHDTLDSAVFGNHMKGVVHICTYLKTLASSNISDNPVKSNIVRLLVMQVSNEPT